MPTLFILEGFRFFFYSNDHAPVHVHVEKNGKTAKFTLSPIELAASRRFNAQELRKIRFMIEEHSEIIIAKWNEYFNYQ